MHEDILSPKSRRILFHSRLDPIQGKHFRAYTATMNPSPDLVLSPFAPGFNYAAFGDRSQCNRSSCGNYGTMKCGRCHCARYCSKECQIADWKEAHKLTCQHPTTESTFLGDVPSSWTSAPNTAPDISSELIPTCNARLVYDDTDRGKSIDTPSIYSMAARPSLRGYLEHHSSSTDGSFLICISNGDGAFVSKVRTSGSPGILLTLEIL